MDGIVLPNCVKTRINNFGYLTIGEAEYLYYIARYSAKHRWIVNIGAGAGTSAMIFRSACPTVDLMTIDVQFASSPYGCISGEIDALKENGLYDENLYHYIVGDSKRVGRTWTFGVVDMVFIDGDHTYEGCYGDIEMWMPHIRKFGVIAIHDYKKEILRYPGVDRAVDELLMGEYRHIKTIDTLTVYRNNKLNEDEE